MDRFFNMIESDFRKHGFHIFTFQIRYDRSLNISPWGIWPGILEREFDLKLAIDKDNQPFDFVNYLEEKGFQVMSLESSVDVTNSRTTYDIYGRIRMLGTAILEAPPI